MRAIIILFICLPCFSKEYFSFNYSFKETTKKYTLGNKGLFTVNDNSGPGECKSFNGKFQTRFNDKEKNAFFEIVKKLKNQRKLSSTPDLITYVKDGEVMVFNPSKGNSEHYKVFKKNDRNILFRFKRGRRCKVIR